MATPYQQGIVCKPAKVVINTSSIYKSGQASGNTQLPGDEGDTQDGRGVSWDVLDFTNPFGNTDRFTDTLGGQSYSNNSALDWSSYDQVNETVRGYFLILQGASRLDTALSSSPYTADTYNDWLIVTGQQLDKITNYNQSGNWINYPPFNLPLSTPIWTRTRQGVNRFFQLSTNGFGNNFFSSNAEIMITRLFTFDELLL
jgi:hypothetical protein